MNKTEKFPRFIRYSILILAGLLGIVLTGFYIWLHLFDIDAQRGKIELYLSSQLQRETRINGGLDLRPSLLTPKIIARDITIENAKWSSDPWLAEAEHVEVSFSLLSLITYDIEFEKISLLNTKLYFENSADGVSNWLFEKPGAGDDKDIFIPSIHKATVDNLELNIRSKDRPLLKIKIPEISASLPEPGPVTMNLKFKYQELPVYLKLRGGSLQSLFDPGHKWPVNGRLSLPSLDIDVNGFLLDVSQLTELDLHLKSIPAKKQKIFQISGWQHHRTGLLDLKLNLKSKNDTLFLKATSDFEDVHFIRPPDSKHDNYELGITFDRLKTNIETHGLNVNNLILNSNADYQLENAKFSLQQAGKQYTEQISIRSLHTRAMPNKMITTKLDGKYDNINLTADIEHDRIINLLWSNKPWPYKANIYMADSQFVTDGAVDQNIVTGNFHAQGKSIDKTVNHFGKKLPELGQFHLAGKYKFTNSQLDLEQVNLKALDSVIRGNLRYSMADQPELVVALTAKKPSLTRLLNLNNKSKNFNIVIDKIDFSGHGKGKTANEILDNFDFKLSSPSIAVVFDNNVNRSDIFLKRITLDNKSSEFFNAVSDIHVYDLPVKTRLKTDSFQSIMKSNSSPISSRLKSGKSSLFFNGIFSGINPDENNQPAISGSIKGYIDNLATMSKPDNLVLPEYKDIQLGARLHANKTGFKLENLKLVSPILELNSLVEYYNDGSLINVSLDNSRIDISPILNAYTSHDEKKKIYDEINNDKDPLDDIAAQTDQQEADKTPLIPDKAIDMNLIKKMNIRGRLTELATFYEKEPINKMSAQVSMESGKLNLKISSKSHTGSNSLIRLNADGTDDAVKAEFSLDLNNLDYGQIFKTLDISSGVSGKLDADINFATQGNTTRELLVNSTGNLEFVSDKGRVPRRLLELWGDGFLRIFLPTTWVEKETTNLHCAIGRFVFDNGYLKSETLLADTERVTVAGEIALNLNTEKLDGIFKSKPKKATIFRIGTPIKVSGTLRQPKSAPSKSGIIYLGKWLIGLSDPYALILLFGDMGARDKNPCKALLKQPVPVQKPGSN